MYRILSARGEVRERRNQLVHPRYQRPELLATGPNQVWTWDITKLAVWINPPEDWASPDSLDRVLGCLGGQRHGVGLGGVGADVAVV